MKNKKEGSFKIRKLKILKIMQCNSLSGDILEKVELFLNLL